MRLVDYQANLFFAETSLSLVSLLSHAASLPEPGEPGDRSEVDRSRAGHPHAGEALPPKEVPDPYMGRDTALIDTR